MDGSSRCDQAQGKDGPAIFLGLAAATLALPVLAVAALVLDLARRRRGIALRLVAMLWVFLAAEAAGIIVLFAVWVAAGPPGERRRRRLVRLDLRGAERLDRRAPGSAAANLLAAHRGRGRRVIEPGPVLVLMRHASIVDTLLPAALITRRHGIRLRYVLKRQLLADPCLDIAGGRLPNAFVGRDSGDSEGEIARVRALARDLTAHDGVLIYPEGSRFTEEVRRHALERMAERGGLVYERGRQMRERPATSPGRVARTGRGSRGRRRRLLRAPRPRRARAGR